MLPLTKQSRRPNSWHKWDKNTSSASCLSHPFRWLQVLHSLMKSDWRPEDLPLNSIPSSTYSDLFSSSRQSWLFLFLLWTELPVLDVPLAVSWISPPGDIKTHPMTTHNLPGSIKAFSKRCCSCGYNFLPAGSQKNLGADPRRRRSQEGHKEKEKSSSAQLYAESQNLKICWLHYEN